MAIRLRCVECRKKLSVDDGFAGGICRCPYCKALMPVAEARRGRPSGVRPALPRGRPASPQAQAGEPGIAGAQTGEEGIVLARPVRLQGILTIVMLAMVVIIVAVLVFMLVMGGLGKTSHNGAEPPDKRVAQDRTAIGEGDGARPKTNAPVVKLPTGPRIDNMAIQPPVGYCIACNTGRTFDFAVGSTLESIRTLDAGQKFQIVLSQEDGCKLMSAEYVAMGPEAVSKAREFFWNEVAGSTRRIAEAVQAAAARQPRPRTIVVIVNDAVGDQDIDKVVAAADAAGAAVLTIILTDEEAVVETMKQLSQKPKAKGKWTVHARNEF